MVNPVENRGQQVGDRPDDAITEPSTKGQEDALLILRPGFGPIAAEGKQLAPFLDVHD